MGFRKVIFFLLPIIIAFMIVVIAFIVSIISFIRDIQQPMYSLERGGIIAIETSEMRNIYVESTFPMPFFTHYFTFTNTETQETIHSMTPNIESRYSIGVVTINNEIRQGRFGMRVATVYLEPGVYVIDFLTYEDSSEFVWDGVQSIMFTSMIKLIILSLLLFALIAAFVLVIEKHKQQKRCAHQ